MSPAQRNRMLAQSIQSHIELARENVRCLQLQHETSGRVVQCLEHLTWAVEQLLDMMERDAYEHHAFVAAPRPSEP